ncbi:MAG: hypothetical protein J6Y74_03395 [Clostridia bacterium]|nr:hypothetical protein [Clostridia bacterium]
MKKFLSIVLSLLLLITLCALSFGCKKKEVRGDSDYYLYAYDMDSRTFVKAGASVRFSDDLTEYSYTFNDGSLTISGKATHSDVPNMYTLECHAEQIELVTNKYRQYLVSSGASSKEVESFDLLKASISPKMQLIAYGGSLFTSSSVELFHVSADGKSDAFEGEFVMTASGETVSLHGGNLYTADDDGKYTVKTGYYTVSNGILTLTTVDADGKDAYTNGVLARKRYLMAKITLPAELDLIGTDFEEQMEEAKWYSLIKEEYASYAGKTISLLTDRFYSASLD